MSGLRQVFSGYIMFYQDRSGCVRLDDDSSGTFSLFQVTTD